MVASGPTTRETVAKPSTRREPWRSEVYCGVNALYVMLRMLGVHATYDQLLKESSVGDRGSSMEELARVARLHGVTLTPMRGKAAGVASWPTPAIVHQQRRTDLMGHYVLYLGPSGDELLTLDCVSGQLASMSKGDFNDKWSGFVLVRSPGDSDRMQVFAQGWLVFGLMVGIGGCWRMLRAPRRGPTGLATGAHDERGVEAIAPGPEAHERPR